MRSTSIRSPIAASQGQRSSSVRGVPLAIFFTLAMGCSESPSTKGTPRCSARPLAMVVLPEPATPITTIKGFCTAGKFVIGCSIGQGETVKRIAGGDGHILLAVHRIGNGRGRDRPTGAEVPQRLAALGVERDELALGRGGEDQPAAGGDNTGGIGDAYHRKFSLGFAGGSVQRLDSRPGRRAL